MTGYKIAKQSLSDYEVYGTFNSRPVKIQDCTALELDITKRKDVEKIFAEIKPDIAINTTALHNVDFCEENPEIATAVNTTAIETLAQNSEKFGTKLIHISTDYVFDGLKNSPYLESDPAKPISFYGKSKLEGEQILNNTNHVVLRPSVVYGWTPMELSGKPSSSGKPINFAMWLLTKLHKSLYCCTEF